MCQKCIFYTNGTILSVEPSAMADTDRLILQIVRLAAYLVLLRTSAATQYYDRIDDPHCDDKDEGQKDSNYEYFFCNCAFKTTR